MLLALLPQVTSSAFPGFRVTWGMHHDTPGLNVVARSSTEKLHLRGKAEINWVSRLTPSTENISPPPTIRVRSSS
jgi:hypothetical protein